MRDAGIGRADVGALLTGRMPRSYCTLQYNQSVLNELKIAPMISTEVTAHGAGALGAIQLAAMLLGGGAIDYALCVAGEASPLWIEMTEGSANWEADRNSRPRSAPRRPPSTPRSRSATCTRPG